MRKFAYWLLVLTLVLPLALPFGVALAQESTAVLDALQTYNDNLPPAYGNVSVADLSVELLENPDLILIDVRQPEDYVAGHIEGAINIPIREVGKSLDLLPDLNAPIVTICGSSFRSPQVMTALQILGYTNVRNMAGGMRAWTDEGLAVSTEPVEPVAGEAPADLNPEVLAAVDAALSGLPDSWGAVKAEDLNVEMTETPPDLLIDVRTPDEWAKGYIAGAVHIPLQELMAHIGELPEAKDANIVVYCGVGHRGNMAATMLRTLGYTNVRNLSGGIGGWTTAGLPIEGAPEAEAVEAEAFDLNAALTDYFAGLPGSFNAIRVPDVAAAIAANPDLVLVDVRTPDEYAEGHFAGAINIPINELTDHLDLLPNQDADIIVYCGSGHRSALGMMALNLLGYDKALSMLGGVKAIADNAIPLVTEPAEVTAGAAPAIDPALLAAVDAYIKAIPAGYYTIGADDLNVALVENPPALIDVRTEPEVANGKIEGAQFLTLSAFMASQDQWPQDMAAPVVIYDSDGHRSAMAMVAMQMLGYENVRSLGGGAKGWTAKNYPLVTE